MPSPTFKKHTGQKPPADLFPSDRIAARLADGACYDGLVSEFYWHWPENSPNRVVEYAVIRSILDTAPRSDRLTLATQIYGALLVERAILAIGSGSVGVPKSALMAEAFTTADKMLAMHEATDWLGASTNKNGGEL